MPIVHDRSMDILLGEKDLILEKCVTSFYRSGDPSKLIDAKSIAIYVNLNGPQIDPDNIDLSGKYRASANLCFTDDDAIDHLILHLQMLKNTKIIEANDND